MALTRLPSFTILNTDSFTFANITLTSNVTANNANLGNAATANYFIGSGNNLSNIQVANITGLGNIATVDKDGNASNILYGNGVFASAPVTYSNSNVATFLASFGSNTLVTTGNITTGNANLGNAATANFFVGNGHYLTNILGTQISGEVAFANKANSVSGSNVTGQVGNALVASTVYSSAQPNITSVGTLTSLSVTGNISSGNANLGNAVVANYFVGDGSLLTGLSATVSNLANTVTVNAQPNITSVGILASLEVSGNTVIGGNLIVNGTTTTINSTVVQIDDLAVVLANDATTGTEANGAGIIINGASANMLYVNSTNSFTFSHKISADGSLLSNLSAANITGTVASATVAASANSVAGANVTGTVSSATVAASANSVAVANVTGIGNIATLNLDGNASNILYGNGSFASAPVTYGNSNVATYLPTYTGNLSPGNLTVTTKANLGSVANVTITGGSANYVLKTDGAGNLSWTEMTGGGGNGGGASTLDDLTDVTLTTPANDDVLKFDVDSSLWINAPIINSVNNPYVTRTYIGDGVDTTFTVSAGTTTDSVIVTLSGIVQTPTSDYSISGTTLTFTTAPPDGIAIQIREIGVPMASGTNSQILFNDAGSMAGAAGLTFNKTTNTLFSTKLATTSANLGLVNNIRITGGSAGQVLTTNGNGSVIWASAVIGSTGNSTVLPDSVVDYFTGDGSTSTFTLSVIPAGTSYVLVNINGVFQFRDSYTLVDDEITFGSVPLNNSRIEVTTLQTGAVQISTFSSSMVPTVDVAYDLGNATHRWRDLYLSGNTLYIGNATVSVSNVTGEIAFTPAPTVSNPTPVSRPIIPDPTSNSGKFLTTDGANVSWGSVDAFPTQTSNTGKYLTTNGTTVSWGNVDTYPTQTNNSGKFLTTNGTAVSWENVLPSQTGNSGKYLTTNGTSVTWTTLSGVLPTPTLSGPTSANEGTNASVTITNYNASHAYIVSVSAGSYTQTGSAITWTLPAVTANTVHYLNVQATQSGNSSLQGTLTTTVNDLTNLVGDAAIVVTDFSINSFNNGWIV